MSAVSERCEVTELLTEQCAHCRPAPPTDPFDTPNTFGPWFTAGYEDDCAGCEGGIAPGDTIRADGRGLYLCLDCGEDHE